MANRDMVDYELRDGVELNRRNPDTFQIPTEEEKDRLVIEDKVKLIFEFDNGMGCERMWVEITFIDDNGISFSGILKNSPISNTNLAFNDVVKFERKHIIDYIIHNY